ncbi:MAG: beta-hydroxyacyl-ACP dehydratase [Chitinivorax sp.]
MPQVPLFVASDHPAFAGHFPGRPIVPGVVLLDLVQRIIEADCDVRLTGLSVAKFHRPVGPGEALQLDYELNGVTARFEIRCGEHKVADGRFSVAPELAG